jgi:hypothetical protein
MAKHPGKPECPADSVPDHPEFWFLRDYPPLTPPQLTAIKRVIRLFRRWEKERGALSHEGDKLAGTSRDAEWGAFVSFMQQLGDFKSRYGFTGLPTDRIGAVRAGIRRLCLPALALARSHVAIQGAVDDAWKLWWDHLDAVTYPPPERSVVRTEQEGRAALTTLLNALNELARRIQEPLATPHVEKLVPGVKQTAKSPKIGVGRDKKAEARNAWLYRQCRQGELTYRQIMLDLKKIAPAKGWTILSTPQAIEQAVKRHIRRHRLDPLPPRKQV